MTKPEDQFGRPKAEQQGDAGNQNIIPAQYQGLSSEEVELIMPQKEYADREKNEAEKARREAILAEVKRQETAREEEKTRIDTQRFGLLDEEQQRQFPGLQQKAAQMVVDHIKGTATLGQPLSREEEFVLSKVKGKWEDAQKNDPDAPLNLQLGRDIDQKVYSNLLNKLAFDQVITQKKEADTSKRETLEQDLGIKIPEGKTKEKPTEVPPDPLDTAGQITKAFDIMGAGIQEGVLAKTEEYDQRIRAAQAGTPLKPYDRVDDLLADFRQWTKQDWTDDFDVKKWQDQYRTGKTEQPANSPENVVSGKLSPDVIESLKLEAINKYKRTGGDPNFDLMMNAVDWEVGERFDAHGLSKVSVPAQLGQLITLLENGIDPNREFHTAPLEVRPENKAGAGAGLGTGGGTANKEGSFVILGGVDSKIKDSGIKHVIVNDAYYHAIDILAKAYPNVEFIRADKAKERLKQIAETK